MTWFALTTVKVLATEDAAKVVESPACEAVTSHVPAATTVKVEPDTEQTAMLDEE
jgi:hypothetical protein